MREWTLTLPRQLPLWEMESRWTPKTSESNCRGQNSMACDVLYIIGKLSKRRCLKWARIAHSNIWNISYGQKKGRWKAFNESYNFASDCTSIRSLLANLWGSKVARVPAGKILGLPLRNPEKKSHLDVASMESCRVYYKGEGGGFPQVRAVMNLVCPCCPWLVLAPRVFQLCTNHFVWVVCRPVWVCEAC